MKNYYLLLLAILFSTQISYGQECLNVKFKLRGYFYAGTSQVDYTAIGGFYEDTNTPKKIESSFKNTSLSDTFQMNIQVDSIVKFGKNTKGFRVYVFNKTDSIIELPAQDSRLYIKRQVFYKDEWKDIEYLPSSWCGNSYHSVFIKPNEYWDFIAPCLIGKIHSKFRFELYINENLSVYSNEFEGSFNKKQLKKEQGHKPVGIMDPYNN